ncbi:MAG: TrmH family RNA methyltransferase, partial [Pseudomonadota bacterium]
RNYEDFIKNCKFNNLYAFTTKAVKTYSKTQFEPDDALLFGPESRGLPPEILNSLDGDNKLRIPMAQNSRSLNLSNTVSIAVYEAWRQLDFKGLDAPDQ